MSQVYPLISTPADTIAGLQCKADIARLAKFSIRTIDSLMAQKKIPFIKIGRSVRFRWPAVEAALIRFERKEIR